MTKLMKYLQEDAKRKEKIKGDLEELELEMSSADKRELNSIIVKHLGKELARLDYEEMVKKAGKNQLISMYDEVKKKFRRYL
jgi:hypothetical protein